MSEKFNVFITPIYKDIGLGSYALHIGPLFEDETGELLSELVQVIFDYQKKQGALLSALQVVIQ